MFLCEYIPQYSRLKHFSGRNNVHHILYTQRRSGFRTILQTPKNYIDYVNDVRPESAIQRLSC